MVAGVVDCEMLALSHPDAPPPYAIDAASPLAVPPVADTATVCDAGALPGAVLNVSVLGVTASVGGAGAVMVSVTVNVCGLPVPSDALMGTAAV